MGGDDLAAVLKIVDNTFSTGEEEPPVRRRKLENLVRIQHLIIIICSCTSICMLFTILGIGSVSGTGSQCY